jgi:hypothetical protein
MALNASNYLPDFGNLSVGEINWWYVGGVFIIIVVAIAILGGIFVLASRRQ